MNSTTKNVLLVLGINSEQKGFFQGKSKMITLGLSGSLAFFLAGDIGGLIIEAAAWKFHFNTIITGLTKNNE